MLSNVLNTCSFFCMNSDWVFFLMMARQLYIDHMDSEKTISCLISLLHRVQPADADPWCVHKAIDMPHFHVMSFISVSVVQPDVHLLELIISAIDAMTGIQY